MLFKCQVLRSRFFKELRLIRSSHHEVAKRVAKESFMSGSSAQYIEELYLQWRYDPSSVHVSWGTYFRLVESGYPPGTAYVSPLKTITMGKRGVPVPVPARAPQPQQAAVARPPSATPATGTGRQATMQESMHLLNIIRAYQYRGHLLADLDPLKLTRINLNREKVLNVKIPEDKSVLYKIPRITFVGGDKNVLSLGEIINRLENSYCKSIGVEFKHLPRYEEYVFLKKRLETPGVVHPLTNVQKIITMARLCQAHHFELFLSKKWPAEKRFGLEGCDVFIPAIRRLVEYANDLGGNSFVFGMAHRGRLNLLVNVLRVPFNQIFSHFQPIEPVNQYSAGDVKYHLGASNVIKHPRSQKPIRVALISNASHLESVNAMVEGFCFADSRFNEKNDMSKVWPVLIHGDAAMTGQGVVYETFHLAELKRYKVGGTIHIVINNQIGFTTDPLRSRSSEYCTCVAKVVDAPVFHVNGDDVEAVMHVMNVAVDFRAKFLRDVVVDIVCYRRHGHNEVDEPMFTQPTMYTVIKQLKQIYYKYSEQLINQKVITKEQVKSIEDEYLQQLEKGFKTAGNTKLIKPEIWLESRWKGFFSAKKDRFAVPTTGVKKEILDVIGKRLSTPPPNFQCHSAILRILKGRNKMLASGLTDWSLGESFAISSLLQEGVYVRLTGQDAERGTFSHRHHVLHDQNTGKEFPILEKIFPKQAEYVLSNSSLCEYGVLGFELGVSLVNPNTLIMWEAQFGDFVNSAQIVIDQYISAGESKWFRQSGLVMLLPHGLEGMGPEHSSARPERFLQSCNDDDNEVTTDMGKQLANSNWFIVNCTTPANFFHVLRRQVKLNYRKPLIVFTPKSLLRHPQCVSNIADYLENTKFKPYIADPDVPPSKDVKKLLLCTGKIYYDLKDKRKEKKLEKNIAIGRLEQIFPMPYKDILDDGLKNYPNARVFWVQEEHKNQGAWSFVAPRINKALGKEKGAVTYVGRGSSSTPATGYHIVHSKERNNLLIAAMTL